MSFRKCPHCTFFAKPADLSYHLKTHRQWRPTRSGNGETMPKKYDPLLEAKVKDAGTLREGGFVYKVYGELLWRKRDAD